MIQIRERSEQLSSAALDHPSVEAYGAEVRVGLQLLHVELRAHRGREGCSEGEALDYDAHNCR